MVISTRELWTVIHGMLLGALFFLAFSGIWVSLWSLHPERMAGVEQRVSRLKVATWATAVVLWLTVMTGTYIVYPWYRAKPPEGADLTQFPRSFLLASPERAGWHSFGMEWKEHVAWISPILASAVAAVVWRYGRQLKDTLLLKWTLVIVTLVSMGAASVAGILGAFITKNAPVL